MERHRDVMPYVDGFADALAGPLSGFKPMRFEHEIVNEAERFIGHSDQESDDVLLELKTGTYQPWAQLQTAAYTLGRRMKRIAISLPGNGSYKLIEHSDHRDKDRFVVLCRAWWVRSEFCKASGDES